MVVLLLVCRHGCLKGICTWKLTSLWSHKWMRIVSRETIAWNLSTHSGNNHWNIVASGIWPNLWFNSTYVISANHTLLIRHVCIVLIQNDFSPILYLSELLLISIELLELLLVEILLQLLALVIHVWIDVLLLVHIWMRKVYQIDWILHNILLTRSKLIVWRVRWSCLTIWWLLLNDYHLLSISNLASIYKDWLLFLTSLAIGNGW